MYECTPGRDASRLALAATPPAEPDCCEATLAVGGDRGLDLLTAGKLAQAADHLAATVMVRCGRTQADARSIFGLLSLQARPGVKLTLTARGPEAAAALARVRAVVEGDHRRT